MKGFAGETKLPVTLVATSAGAYQGDKMYNIAEEARRDGMDIRPQIAGRPTGVLHGLKSSFHVFMGHPTYKAEVAPLPHAEKLAAMARPEMPRRHPGRGKPDQTHADGREPGRAVVAVPCWAKSRTTNPTARRACGAWPRRPAWAADGDDVRPAAAR